MSTKRFNRELTMEEKVQFDLIKAWRNVDNLVFLRLLGKFIKKINNSKTK